MIEMSLEQLTEESKRVSNFGATVKITGLWAWAVFPEKPSAEIRAEMKNIGWKWSKNKSAWYLSGKISCSRHPHSFDYIADKYGVIDVPCTALAIA